MASTTRPPRERQFGMIVLEDFTQVAAGQEIPCEGPTVRCPRCGRSGLVQQSGEGLVLCVHSQTSEVLGDGLRTEPQECCSMPNP